MQTKSVLSLMVAATPNGHIGREGRLLCRIPSDMHRFRERTMGHPVIMGRKTWESIPQKFRPLSERTNIVVTRQSRFVAKDAIIVNSIEDAHVMATYAPGADEIFIAGGAEIYRQFLPLAQIVYVTTIWAPIEGDTHFPKLDPSHWWISDSEPERRGEEDEYSTSFEILRRVN